MDKLYQSTPSQQQQQQQQYFYGYQTPSVVLGDLMQVSPCASSNANNNPLMRPLYATTSTSTSQITNDSTTVQKKQFNEFLPTSNTSLAFDYSAVRPSLNIPYFSNLTETNEIFNAAAAAAYNAVSVSFAGKLASN